MLENRLGKTIKESYECVCCKQQQKGMNSMLFPFSIFIKFDFPYFLLAEVEVRDRLLGSGNMIKICTTITKLEQNYVTSFGVFLIDHILSIVLRYLADDDPRVRRDANSTLLYLIENRFFKVGTIKKTIYPVILDLLKTNLNQENSSDHDIQLNSIGVSESFI